VIAVTVRAGAGAYGASMLRRKWPRSATILMGIAVALAISAFFLVRGFERRVEEAHPDVGPTVSVTIAAAELPRGTVLTEAMLSTTSIPQAYAPPGAIASPAAAAGRVLTADVAAGEALTASRLAAPRVGPVAALVPSGLRAIVVPTDLPAAAVRAGDRVELYATYGGGHPHAELVASGLEVLRVLSSSSPTAGIAGSAAGSRTDGVSLVVLVDPDSAERLAYARTFGAIEVAILATDVATG